MKWKAATFVLLLAGMLSACGNSQETQVAAACKKNSGLSDSICECIAKKMVASVSDKSLTLFMDVANGMADSQDSGDSSDLFGQAQQAQAKLQEIASEHGMSVFELKSKLQPIGQQMNNAQNACTNSS